MQITFFGHAGFAFTDGSHTLLIDPFLSGNPAATIAPDAVRCTHIALTHGHEDHLGDSVTLAVANRATVIASFEICSYLKTQGVANTEPGNPGGKVTTPFGWVAFTQAFHSSSYRGQYMGMPCGLVAHLGGKTIYHCGDTALFSDMRLLGEIYRPDVACIPIGDRFTMGPELATRAAEMINPVVAIPMHYDTWPQIAQSPSDFAPAGVTVKIMRPGESWEVP